MTEPGASLDGRRSPRDADLSPDRVDPEFDGGQNPRSIWPAIYPELLELVREHTSTIIFVNNRRGAERLAKRLNELANEQPASRSCRRPSTPATPASPGPQPARSRLIEVARAHHGSLAHEERIVVEELLKSGKLPCLVATSSLELGIDMGAVDLVIQVESPKSVTRGLQRSAAPATSSARSRRAGSSPSSAPTCSSARSSRGGCARGRSRRRSSRGTRSTCWPSTWSRCARTTSGTSTRSSASSRRPSSFSELSREQLENVLDMLDGRYPSERFAELRPRIVWDRTGGTIRGRKGARQLAVTNAGTIPDRGLYGVHLPDGRRVGELDEEMVYEARPGQTFLLGASTWRIEEITRDRVIVTPAPGTPGAVPFWRGDGDRPPGGARAGDRRVRARGGRAATRRSWRGA